MTMLLFPQGKGLLDSIFGAAETSGCYGLPDERLLFGSELHFHVSRVEG
jgi:hypothetical protein